VREVAIFLIKDLRELADAFQVTNEMGVPRFTKPLTMEEAAKFIGMHLSAMRPHKGSAIIGYNSAGPQADLHPKMKPWLKYCDYVGVDIYIGCFVGIGCWLAMFDVMLKYIWSITNKPVILAEFGYISGGSPKNAEEKRAVLRRYGVSSEAEARAKPEAFMEAIKNNNEKMYNYIKKNASGDYCDFIFQLDFCNHFYSELPKRTVIKKYPHTPEGQAGFYRDIYPRLAKLPFLIGAFFIAAPTVSSAMSAARATARLRPAGAYSPAPGRRSPPIMRCATRWRRSTDKNSKGGQPAAFG